MTSSDMSDIWKVCQFFSRLLSRIKDDSNFNHIKDIIYKYINNSIDLSEFVASFPNPLPETCQQILQTKRSLLSHHLYQNTLQIDFMNFQIKSEPEIKIVNRNVNNVVRIANNGDNSRPKIKIINCDKKTIPPRVLKAESIAHKNIEVSKTTGCSIGNVTHTDVARKRSPPQPLIVTPAKKKKIDISIQSHTNSELKKIPAIQAYNLGADAPVKPDIKPVPAANVDVKQEVACYQESFDMLTNLVTEESMRSILQSGGLKNVDFENVFAYFNKALAMFVEKLLVKSAYYTLHRCDCRLKFKPNDSLYAKLDDNRNILMEIINNKIFEAADKEIKEKAQLYEEQTKRERLQQQKQDMERQLSNQKIDRTNNTINIIFNSKKPVASVVTTSSKPIIIKKRITTRDFLIVLRQDLRLQKYRTYKSVLEAVKK